MEQREILNQILGYGVFSNFTTMESKLCYNKWKYKAIILGKERQVGKYKKDN